MAFWRPDCWHNIGMVVVPQGMSYAIVLVLPCPCDSIAYLVSTDCYSSSTIRFISSFVGVLIYCVSMHDLFLHFLTTTSIRHSSLPPQRMVHRPCGSDVPHNRADN